VRGILSFGAYVPTHRLARSAIAAALGTPAGKGSRSVASYDEDSTSMGVEAARRALAGRDPGAVATLLFSTTTPAYADKTNATAIHAALGLPAGAAAYDLVGSVRSAVGALRAALEGPRPTLAVASDIRTGLPGGADERDGGDAAAAFLCGEGDGVVGEYLGGASSTAEFLDRWRAPGEPASRTWEERFGEDAYVPLAREAVAEALTATGLDAEKLDHVAVTGTHARAVRRVAALAAGRPEVLVDDLAAIVGNAGAAHPGLVLISALERAEPGQIVALVVLADGADVFLFRGTPALSAVSGTGGLGLAAQVASGRAGLSYQTFLTWRGMLTREPPRRPDPQAPAAPPARRSEDWKFAFTASRCEACGTRHLPPERVCLQCRAVDRMAPERLADVPATVATYTIDRLAYSLSPPVVVGVLDFDGGGRFQCELTDVDPAAVRIGDRVEMTFRRMHTADGIHNYFWKARPVRSGNGIARDS
jgi:hydroxymethylglutaryl-CoA synthase